MEFTIQKFVRPIKINYIIWCSISIVMTDGRKAVYGHLKPIA